MRKDEIMAKSTRRNTAFVVGSVIGGVVGAVGALWKTPYSGEELRSKLGMGSSDSTTVNASRRSNVTTTYENRSDGTSFQDKVLGKVESTLAPLVGVSLGKTANGSEGTSTTAASRVTTTTTTSPLTGSTSTVSGTTARSADTMSTPVESISTPNTSTASTFTDKPLPADDQPATLEQLTTPQIDLVPDAITAQEPSAMHPFPKLGGLERKRS